MYTYPSDSKSKNHYFETTLWPVKIRWSSILLFLMLVLLILYYITYLLFVHVFFRLYCVERHKVVFGLDWKQSSKIGIMKWVDLPKQSLLWLVLLIIQTLNTLSVFSPLKFECFFNFFSLRKKNLLSLTILLSRWSWIPWIQYVFSPNTILDAVQR